MNSQKASEYLSEIVNAGLGGYVKLFRDIAVIKTGCTSPWLWTATESEVDTLIQAVDKYMNLVEKMAVEVASDNELLGDD
ncbi:MAG: hypothetical protein J7497_08280 [Chitinophagaceae bacterium]|nr:hypothetical protein [Chitinophagaceae bacterium]